MKEEYLGMTKEEFYRTHRYDTLVTDVIEHGKDLCVYWEKEITDDYDGPPEVFTARIPVEALQQYLYENDRSELFQTIHRSKRVCDIFDALLSSPDTDDLLEPINEDGTEPLAKFAARCVGTNSSDIEMSMGLPRDQLWGDLFPRLEDHYGAPFGLKAVFR